MSELTCNKYWHDKKVMYVSMHDVSLPNGPGVNEREFIGALLDEFKDRALCLIPSPAARIDLCERQELSFPRSVSFGGPLGKLFVQFGLFRLAMKHLSKHQYDLVVFRTGYFPWHIYLLTRFKKFNYVVKTAGLSGEGLRNKGGWKKLVATVLASLDYVFMKRILSGSLLVDACTKRLVDGVTDRYKLDSRRVVHIENATNTSLFDISDSDGARKKKGLERFSRVVGYVGGSPSERGAKELVEALPEILEKFPGAGALIVGDDRGMGAVKVKAEHLGVSDSVFFVGQVPYDDVPGWMACLDVGIAFDDPEKLKITGNSNQKVRQYLASGIPVVVSQGGNEFVSSNNLGSVIDHQRKELVVRSIIDWLAISKSEERAFKARSRSYAMQNLSVSHALQERLSFWQENMPKRVSG